MGWTTIRHSGDVMEDLHHSMIGKGFKVVEYKKTKNIIYTAIRNEDTGKIFGEVFLFCIGNSEISFKGIEEDTGPFYYGTGKKIIKILSPTKNEIALEWRRKCLMTLKKGKICKFKESVYFQGKGYTEFVYLGNNIFQPIGENFGLRCKYWRDYI